MLSLHFNCTRGWLGSLFSTGLQNSTPEFLCHSSFESLPGGRRWMKNPLYQTVVCSSMPSLGRDPPDTLCNVNVCWHPAERLLGTRAQL